MKEVVGLCVQEDQTPFELQSKSALHDRFTRGEALTSEERIALENWYAEQDRAEAGQLRIDSTSTDTAALRAQVDAALVRLNTVSGEIQQLAEGNETLRREIAALRRQLAQESSSKAA